MSDDAPDMILFSGREDLPLADRGDLLRSEVLLLQMNAPPEPTRAEWRADREKARASGAWIHDFIGMTSFAISLCDGIVKNPERVARSRELGRLSRAECLVMAWRRGGHQEQRRVSKAQHNASWVMQNEGKATLDRAYVLCAAQQDQAAVEVVLAFMEQALRTGHFYEVDLLLKKIDITRLRAAPLLALLSITSHGRDELEERASFVQRAEAQMIQEIGADRARALLEHRR